MALFAFGERHESCARQIRKLTERVEQLELSVTEHHLAVLDVAERVAHKLEERVHKRKPEARPADGKLTPQEKGSVVRQGGWGDGILSR